MRLEQKILRDMGGQMAHWKNHLYRVKIWHSKHLKVCQGSLGVQVLTSIVTRIRLGPSVDRTGPLIWALCFTTILLAVDTFFFYKIRSLALLNVLENFFWHQWDRTGALGTHLDLHGPQNGAKILPCNAKSRGLLVKKGLPGSLQGLN